MRVHLPPHSLFTRNDIFFFVRAKQQNIRYYSLNTSSLPCIFEIKVFFLQKVRLLIIYFHIFEYKKNSQTNYICRHVYYVELRESNQYILHKTNLFLIIFFN